MDVIYASDYPLRSVIDKRKYVALMERELARGVRPSVAWRHMKKHYRCSGMFVEEMEGIIFGDASINCRRCDSMLDHWLPLLLAQIPSTTLPFQIPQQVSAPYGVRVYNPACCSGVGKIIQL